MTTRLLSRRWLVGRTMATGLGMLLGCGESAGSAGAGGAGGAGGQGGAEGGCGEEPGGEAVGEAVIEPLPELPLDTKIGVGWDARLYLDLSTLSPDKLITPNELFYIRTEHPDRLDETQPWSIRVHGLVDAEVLWSMSDVEALVAPQGVNLLECSGNAEGGGFGLISAADWDGAPLLELLESVSVQPSATRVLVSGFDEHSVPSAGGHSTPGASWIFTFAELERAFLATGMNGAALPKDHGFPVRLLVPGWYGCCCIKWVNEIALVDDSAPATSQMQEFASRTHQSGMPALAADYIPATMDQTAMPVRVEKWRVDGAIVHRLVGIAWGGYQPTGALTISFDGGASYEPVAPCPEPTDNRSWWLWSHLWRPAAPGSYRLRMGVADPAIATRRLDLGWYDRTVVVDEV